jgi:hypothetical protein
LNIPHPKTFQLVQKDVATATGKMTQKKTALQGVSCKKPVRMDHHRWLCSACDEDVE